LASTDEAYIGDYMRRAIELARIAGANGDTPVGSLVVHKGRVISEGFEVVRKRMDISGHAELIAIRNACSALQTLDLSGCTLYTTAEPCFMCSYAVRQTHINKVIIGGPASKAGGISSHHPILRDAQIAGWGEPPDIIAGILQAECLALRAQAIPAGARTRNEVDL
jgi:tRNA(adenine34) deaminase